MAKVAWSCDGDQWVGKLSLGKLGIMEARITEWCGPLGDEFMVSVRGSHVGTCGGGVRLDALACAKKMATERLQSEAENYRASVL